MDDRRKLKHDYKTRKAIGAIYAIDCSDNNRRWIKSTVDLEGIRSRFSFAQATKTAPDPAMNNEWLKYGSDSFTFTVLEELEMKEGQSPAEFAADIKQLYELYLDGKQ